MARREIKTFVFFDLEATGLDNPRVTEISMIAMNRKAGMEMVYEARKRLWAPSLFECPPDLPRVQNKLTLCIYPMKPVHPDAADITGLNNDNLYQQKDFDVDVGELLKLFIRRLEPPVCLVAHNGNRYDYPLLIAELLSIGGSVTTSISKEPLLCMDTWEMFRDLNGDPVTYPNKFLRDSTSASCLKADTDAQPPHFENNTPQETTPKRNGCSNGETPCAKKIKFCEAEIDSGEQTSNGVVSEDHSRVCRKLFPDNSSDDYDWSQSPIDISVFENESFDLSQNDDLSSKQDPATTSLSVSPADACGVETSVEVSQSGHQNEERDDSIMANSSAVENSHLIEETCGQNSKQCAEDMHFSSLGSNGLKRELANDHHRNDALTCGENHSTEDKFKEQTADTFISSFSGPITLTGSARPTRRIVGMSTKRPSYKLVDVHQRVVGYEPPESHRAEDDCLTLARVFWLTPNAPLWADVNAIELDRFDPIYSVRPRRPFPVGIFPSSSG